MAKKESKRLILVTNDDGVTSPGIKSLVQAASEFGRVVVIAPDSPQSGQGHAITLEEPIQLHKSNLFKGIEAYECSGTPADCVKLAKAVLLKDEEIDLCLSGINHGANSSVNILYSGTMSAAMEAAIEGIPAIGFSLLNYAWEADFEASIQIASHLIKYALAKPFPETKLLNVNIPNLPLNEIKGIKFCRQAFGYWKEEYKKMENPRNLELYWLTGSFVPVDAGPDTDHHALENGYVSVVPCSPDLTHYNALDAFKKQKDFPLKID